MKDIEELAYKFCNDFFGEDNSSHPSYRSYRYAFIAGYTKAKEWISVEDGLPDVLDTDYDVIAKDDSEEKYILKIYSDDDDYPFSDTITHWRYID